MRSRNYLTPITNREANLKWDYYQGVKPLRVEVESSRYVPSSRLTDWMTLPEGTKSLRLFPRGLGIDRTMVLSLGFLTRLFCALFHFYARSAEPPR